MPDGQQNTHYNINKLNSIVFRKNRRPAETTGVGWESWQSNPENGRLRGVWWWRQEWPREGNGGSEEETKEENCDWLISNNNWVIGITKTNGSIEIIFLFLFLQYISAECIIYCFKCI